MRTRNFMGMAAVAFVATLLIADAFGAWPTGKKHAVPGVRLREMSPRVNVVAGAAASTSIYLAGIKTSDVIMNAWWIDTTGATGKMVQWVDHTTSIYVQDADTVRDTLTTAKGILFVLWADVE